MMHVSLNVWHAYCTRIRLTGTGDNNGKKMEDVARMVETVALGSAGKSTQKLRRGSGNTWVKKRKVQGKGPWLKSVDDPNKALTGPLEFMTSRCFVQNIHQSAVRYLAAIIVFHKMFAGWELPLSHCMIVAVGKGIDRAHGMYTKNKNMFDCP